MMRPMMDHLQQTDNSVDYAQRQAPFLIERHFRTLQLSFQFALARPGSNFSMCYSLLSTFSSSLLCLSYCLSERL